MYPLPPSLRISQSLFAPLVEEHYARFAALFTSEDRILDIGAGLREFQRYCPQLQVDSIDTDYGREHEWEPNTLVFSESIGYIQENTLLKYLATHKAQKVVIKDFLGTQRAANTPWNYDFTRAYTMMVPALLSMGYQVLISFYEPDRTRWLQILETMEIEPVMIQGIKHILIVAVKDRTPRQ